ncbi:MAG: histidine phosphatase family protein [Parvibaculum sp.]
MECAHGHTLSRTPCDQANAILRASPRRARSVLWALRESPLRRCRETSEPLATLWGRVPYIEPRVAEVPSAVEDLAARGAWLRRLRAGTWAEANLPENNGNGALDLIAWRDAVGEALTELTEDTVIFAQFIAINVAAGLATGDDRLVCFRPDNCSVTVLETSGKRIRLVEQGREADTRVN